MMMKNAVVAVALAFCLVSFSAAQEQVAVKDIAIDKLLDGVRVTIACTGIPNVSSFASQEPTAVVVDVMDATENLDAKRFESQFYPVSAVTVEPSEATEGVRIAIRLDDMVDYQVTREGELVVVDLGATPVTPAPVPPGDPFANKRLTLYVKDADLPDVLRMIASQFDIDVLMTQDVKSVVTVRLNDVPLRTALGALLKAGLCNMVMEAGDIIVVKPIKKEMYGEFDTRLFELDYVEAEDAVKTIDDVLSDDGKAEVTYRRVADGAGSERSGVLVVTDIPEALDKVAAVLAELDRPVPQIAIEAKFIETTHTSEDRFGINWTLRASATGADVGDWEVGEGLPIIVNNYLIGTVRVDDMNASLEVMASRGKSRTLANPRTVTLDNQRSLITMGIDVPLREINESEGGRITVTWRTRSVPIELEVTPHVTASGDVTMHIRPTVEAITGWVGTADDQQPIVARREAETQVTVRDGEAVVIGGLVRDEETRAIGKIPLLGDIPIIGHLFKKTAIRHEKNDLMIFVIPHVLPMQG
jgi:type IV pilus assembly protein PilQ